MPVHESGILPSLGEHGGILKALEQYHNIIMILMIQWNITKVYCVLSILLNAKCITFTKIIRKSCFVELL